MIQFDQVRKSFGDKEVLKGLSFKIDAGETFFLVGLSGAGKSVTLKHMVRLLKPTQGEIFVDGQPTSGLRGQELESMRSQFGYLFQSGALLQWMNLRENVALPLREHKLAPEDEINDRVMETLKKVGLNEASEKFPSEISGGMKKRAGLARAIITRPQIVLYDEPTSGLDPVTSRTIDELIDELREDLGVTSVVVTHDMISALMVGSRIAMLHLGELIELSDPETFLASSNKVVRSFLDAQHIPQDFLKGKG